MYSLMTMCHYNVKHKIKKNIKLNVVQYKDYIHKDNQKLITESIINHKITSVIYVPSGIVFACWIVDWILVTVADIMRFHSTLCILEECKLNKVLKFSLF